MPADEGLITDASQVLTCPRDTAHMTSLHPPFVSALAINMVINAISGMSFIK